MRPVTYSARVLNTAADWSRWKCQSKLSISGSRRNQDERVRSVGSLQAYHKAATARLQTMARLDVGDYVSIGCWRRQGTGR